MSEKKQFHFEFTCEATLSLDEIWPDGDAPENPTAKDVIDIVEKCGGAREVLGDWFNDDIELTVVGASGDLGVTW